MKSFAPVLLLTSTLVSASVFTVGVGKDETTGKLGIGFDPSVIVPHAGDTVTFVFQSGEHSVVQSSFEHPCTPSGNFDSGVQTVSSSTLVDASGLPEVTLTINDTQPLWFFDQAGGDCAKGGVLAMNPTADQTSAAFKDNAAKDTTSSTPTSASASGSVSQTLTSSTSTTESASTISNAASNTAVDKLWSFGILLALVNWL
ncbi:hypothetical protein C8J56DRAFT_972054 [Mycena floridula]|nr:hypothetical protein C8J56DRAFT_972054 [Mycena floridula]